MPKAVVTEAIDWFVPSVEVWEHDDVAWRVELRWAEVDGYAECIGLRIAPVEREQPLRASTIRALPFGKLVRNARSARYEKTWGPVIESVAGTDLERHVPDGAEREAQPWTAKAQPRRPQLNDDHYAEVARIYSNAVARGAAPRKAVAVSMYASEPTAARWISEARTRGLLPATTPGKARGAAPAAMEEK